MSRPDQYRQRDPLAIEALLTEDQRRPSTIEIVVAFRAAIESPNRIYDEIDELVEEIRKAEFEEKGARP